MKRGMLWRLRLRMLKMLCIMLLSLLVLLLLLTIVRQLLECSLHMLPPAPLLLFALRQGAGRLLLSLIGRPSPWMQRD
jgi:hypothetical protein